MQSGRNAYGGYSFGGYGSEPEQFLSLLHQLEAELIVPYILIYIVVPATQEAVCFCLSINLSNFQLAVIGAEFTDLRPDRD